MSRRSKVAYVSAAVVALMYGPRILSATSRDLTWDSDPLTAGVQDAGGNWDTATSNWFDSTNNVNVAWDNSGDNAIFGNASSAFVNTTTPNNIDLGAALTVQNITLGVGTNGAVYNIAEFNGGSLTVNGNITKSAGTGFNQILLSSGPLNLSTGNHTFAINDSPGDAAPELSVNNAIVGPGGITIDNGSFVTFGTVAFNADNSYTGALNINKGRLVITTAGGLSSMSSGTTISNLGTLSIGGGGTILTSGLNITAPITITRSTYSGGDFADYPAAIIFANSGPAQTHTLSGPITVDSADARISVNTNTLNIPGGIFTFTPAAMAANAVVSFTGDYAGFVKLQGSNPQFATNGIKLVNAVEVSFDTDDSLGGTTAPITFSGDATLDLTGHPTFTTFGSHPINTASFSGGLDIPTGQTFNETLVFTGGNGLGTRGGGTLNLNANMTTTGSTGGVFWNAGTVNVNAAVSLGALHLRSPIVNINNGASLNLAGTGTNIYSAFGEDSLGTNNGPDQATVNMYGNATLTTSTQEFDLAFHANTKGTLTLNNTSSVSAGGASFLGASSGAVGTVVLNDNSSYTATGSMNIGGTTAIFSGNVNSGTGSVTLNNNSTLTTKGQFFIGGGTGGVGTLTINGTSTVLAQKTGAQSFAIGGGTNGRGSVTMTGGTLTVTGEFWTGNNTGSQGTFTQSGGTTTTNDWFVVGRGGGIGSYDLSGGTFTKQGANSAYVGETNNAGSTMTVEGTGVYTQKTGTFIIGNNSGSGGTVTVKGSGQFNDMSTGAFTVGTNGTTATLNVQGNGVVTQSGGDFYVGNGGATANTANVNIQDSGSVTDSSGQIWVGNGNAHAQGIVTISGGQFGDTNNWLAVGRNAGVGIINVQGGTLTKAGANFLTIGSGTSGNGTVNETSGTITSNSTLIGESGTGLMNLSGGTASLGALQVGYANAGSGTLTISGTAAVTASTFTMGTANTAAGTVNLNGGTLTVPAVVKGAGTGTTTFNFNGGTLQASADSTTFMQGLAAANVKNGGAILDTNSHNITIAQALVASGTGGLTKNGPGTLTLAATGNNYTGDTNINAGTLSISASTNLGSATNGIGFGGGTLSTTAAIASGTRNITVNAGGGTIDSGTFASTFGNVNGTDTLTKLSAGTVNVNYVRTTGVTVSGGTVKVAASTSTGGTSVVTNLNVAGGELDVNDNKLVITSGTLGAWNSTSQAYSGVTGQVASGYANAAWTGNGIITSQTAANSAHQLTTLAVDSAADARGLVSGATTTFGGQTVAAADVLVMYTYAGDANLSGSITGDDYARIDAGFAAQSPTMLGYANGDFNYDGKINADDYFLIDRNYSAQGSAFPAAPGLDALPAGVVAVPEPAAIGLLGLAAVGGMRRRRRRA